MYFARNSLNCYEEEMRREKSREKRKNKGEERCDRGEVRKERE